MVTETAALVRQNIAAGDFGVLRHAAGQMALRGISVEEVLAGVAAGEAIEDYPDDEAGPAVLLLLHGADGRALHVVWRIAAATAGPAWLVTAYRPLARQWSDDFRTRRPVPKR